MSRLIKIRNVYYHILEGNPFIFSDERIKKKLLDIVLEIQRSEEWTICAFCIMDETAHFVTESASMESVQNGMQRIADSFLKRCPRTLPGWQGLPMTLRMVGTALLKTAQEVAFCCRKVHRIPLEEGYVDRLADYWWSSYITYAGIYDWRIVDCRRFSEYYLYGEKSALLQLQHFHGEIE
ncbi:MAG: hypothetical protein SOX32_11685 [Candidatus Choladocola sp.]|nr:hypothetical protein [Candidatus Choladocola sp.]